MVDDKEQEGEEKHKNLHSLTQDEKMLSSRKRLAKKKLGFSFHKMRSLRLLFLLWVGWWNCAQAEEMPIQFSTALQEKADSGDEDSQFQLGDCYFFGLGVKKDQREGVAWYRKAAEQGQMKAQFNLGGCLHEGLGTEPSLTEAIYWWRKAAGQDYPPAEISIGDAYVFGRGFAQDEEEGVRWYRKAAQQNYAAAQHRLGNCYFNGQGVQRSVVQAIQWYRKAAEQNYGPSLKALAKLEPE
jgi:TPR repeat protein